MSVNKNQKHVQILPEDEANRQIARGFILQLDSEYQRQIQMLPVAGGWKRVLEEFNSLHAKEMDRYDKRYMILLIDFDDKIEERRKVAESYIQRHLADRVFVIGARNEPERLKSSFRCSYSEIGLRLANECREDKETELGWAHDLIDHNKSELLRMRQYVRLILFPTS
ncbi:MAG TPA: hypothetical protein VFC63_19135 [Blastocatellia bacterium]|nr:hypothetical protein [Blastocatellia bacterium]